jgi:hypothetical protein
MQKFSCRKYGKFKLVPVSHFAVPVVITFVTGFEEKKIF